MPTSGVAAAEFDVATVTEMAGRRAGWEVETLTAGHAILARQLLVGVLNEWSNLLMIPWAADQRTLTLAAGVGSYSLGGDVIDLMPGVTIADAGGTESVLARMSREEYATTTNDDQRGRPSMYWLWRRAVPTLFLTTTPDKVYTITYWCVRRLHDVTAAQQTLDAPMRWVTAIIDRLALELFDSSPAEWRMKHMPIRPSLVERAAVAERTIRQADVEQSSWFVFG